MYQVCIETHFDSAHQLNGYDGECGKLHGHRWKVQVYVNTDHLDKIGISIDFKDLKTMTHEVIRHFDHNYLNKIPPFDDINPTAEHLAQFIFQEIKNQLPSHTQIAKVTLWESEKYAVSYSEGQNAHGQ